MSEAVSTRVDASGFMISLRGHAQLQGALPKGVHHLNLPLPARPLLASWKQWYQPDLRWFFRGYDVVHGTNFVVPPVKGIATVVTVHDLTPLLYPHLCRPEVLSFPALIRHAIDAGAIVHTPSEFVRAEVLEHFSVDASRVVAIAHGVTPLVADPKEPPVARLLDGRPYILAMSTLEPRKGLVYLVRAFGQISDRHPEVRLVLTGQPGWGMEELLAEFQEPSVSERILMPGYVTDEERSWLLRNANVFAYPSLYEGFGLPLLEAMSVGTPVATTFVGAIREIAADAAIMVAPRAVDELAQALEVLLYDSATRALMIERGYTRAAQFSWEANGEQMAALYARAAAT